MVSQKEDPLVTTFSRLDKLWKNYQEFYKDLYNMIFINFKQAYDNRGREQLGWY